MFLPLFFFAFYNYQVPEDSYQQKEIIITKVIIIFKSQKGIIAERFDSYSHSNLF